MKSEPTGSGRQPDSQTPPAVQSVEVEVGRLVSLGKCKQAVELAKEHHKKTASADSQKLLVRAYVSRIQQFCTKGMAEEARTLLNLVQERFPTEQHQFQELSIRVAAAAGRIDDLLRPLASEQTPVHTRDLIQQELAQKVIDLPAVAACKALPADHPLRVGAAAVWRALTAVASGPVTDEAIALPEISHRGPFAAWKMAIRAMAAFYRQDDAGCLRALDAIGPDSAAAPIASALRGLLDAGKPLTGISGALRDRIIVNDRPLRSALEKIESSFDDLDPDRLQSGIRESLRLCAALRPALLEKLRQHISVACYIEQAPTKFVAAAMGITRKDAYFWRLLARSSESTAPQVISAVFWHRFLCHGVDEKMFAQNSPEAAVVWLHIADLVAPISLRQLAMDRQLAGRENIIRAYYDKQPPEIFRLRPESDKSLADVVLAPGKAFEEAAKIQPDAETFSKWWAWAQRVDLPDKGKEDIALLWKRLRPRDAQPLVILSSLAELRNAFSKAIKWVDEAEAIDPMNQQVRRARLRLTLSIAWRHFADRKPHLVEKDLAELQAMPSMGEGDRAGVLESMRGAWHSLRGDLAAENASDQAVQERLGPLLGPVVFHSIRSMAKREFVNPASAQIAADAQPLDVALAHARALRLSDDLAMKIWRPVAWDGIVVKVLRQEPCPLSIPDLLLLGDGAINHSKMESAYLASAAGLDRVNPPAITAKLLLLRAKSLDRSWQQQRSAQCLRAALALAKQSHDDRLSGEIFSRIDRDDFTYRIVANSKNGGEMSEELLQAVLKNEKKAREYPKNQLDASAYVVAEAVETADEREPLDDFGLDEDNEYEDDDEFASGPFDGGSYDNFDAAEAPSVNSFSNLQNFKQLLATYGIDAPEQLAQNPHILLEIMSKTMGRNLTDIEKTVLVEQITDLVSQSGDGFQSRKKQKKRRR